MGHGLVHWWVRWVMGHVTQCRLLSTYKASFLFCTLYHDYRCYTCRHILLLRRSGDALAIGLHHRLHFAWVVDDAKYIVVTAVCLSVPRHIPALLRGPDVSWWNGRGCPLVVHYCADLRSRFHPHQFTFGGVISERVNTVKARSKVNPIGLFGWSLASSRIISRLRLAHKYLPFACRDVIDLLLSHWL